MARAIKSYLIGITLGITAVALPATTLAQQMVEDQWLLEQADVAEDTPRQDYTPDPAVWLLADDDTRIYLLGTIHILPDGFKWRSPLINGIVDEVDELVLETVDDEDGVEDLALIADVLEQSKERPALSDRVSPDNREKLAALAEQLQLPMALLDALPLWLLSFFVEMTAEVSGSTLGGEGVEEQLTRDFLAAGKPISAIEDGNAVVRAMSQSDDSAMLADFDEALSRWSGEGPFWISGNDELSDEPDLAEHFVDDHDWATGNAEALARGLSSEDLGEVFYKVLLVDRNSAWTQWLHDRLERPGSVLVAVGAGHFAGPDSVLKMLSDMDLVAKRLNPRVEETD